MVAGGDAQLNAAGLATAEAAERGMFGRLGAADDAMPSLRSGDDRHAGGWDLPDAPEAEKPLAADSALPAPQAANDGQVGASGDSPRAFSPPATRRGAIAGATASALGADHLPSAPLPQHAAPGSQITPLMTGEDCGQCLACLDKPKFGGPGIKRKGCLAKRTSAALRPPAAALIESVVRPPNLGTPSSDPREEGATELASGAHPASTTSSGGPLSHSAASAAGPSSLSSLGGSGLGPMRHDRKERDGGLRERILRKEYSLRKRGAKAGEEILNVTPNGPSQPPPPRVDDDEEMVHEMLGPMGPSVEAAADDVEAEGAAAEGAAAEGAAAGTPVADAVEAAAAAEEEAATEPAEAAEAATEPAEGAADAVAAPDGQSATDAEERDVPMAEAEEAAVDAPMADATEAAAAARPEAALPPPITTAASGASTSSEGADAKCEACEAEACSPPGAEGGASSSRLGGAAGSSSGAVDAERSGSDPSLEFASVRLVGVGLDESPRPPLNELPYYKNGVPCTPQLKTPEIEALASGGNLGTGNALSEFASLLDMTPRLPEQQVRTSQPPRATRDRL